MKTPTYSGQYNGVLTVREIGEILRIGRNNAYSLVQRAERENLFPVLRLGQQYRVPAQSFQQWMIRQS